MVPSLMPGLLFKITGEWPEFEISYINAVWLPFVLLVYPLLHSMCRYLVDLERRLPVPQEPDGPA